MLNLASCAVIPNTNLDAVAAILKQANSKGWDSQAKCVEDFKKEIMDQGLALQNNSCIWCTLKVGKAGRRTAHRDHIAPKGLYPQWTFLPSNLAITCEFCNGFHLKGDIDTVEVCDAEYCQSEFFIVHPYIDDTSRHIQFVDNQAGHPVIIKGISRRGTWTIETLDLYSDHMTILRAQDYIFAKALEGMPNDASDLLLEAVSHKDKGS